VFRERKKFSVSVSVFLVFLIEGEKSPEESFLHLCLPKENQEEKKCFEQIIKHIAREF
jgi:hypothetical protein